MNDNGIILDENNAYEEKPCIKCIEKDDDMQIVAIFLLVVLFIGPIIGMLIGLFAGKKLSCKGQ